MTELLTLSFSFIDHVFDVVSKVILKYKLNGFPAMLCAVLSCSVMSNSFAAPRAAACQAPLPWGFSRQEHKGGLSCPLLGDLPNPEIKPRSPALQADSLLSEAPEKSQYTGVGNQSLLQGIFLTQESNLGLLHFKRILY